MRLYRPQWNNIKHGLIGQTYPTTRSRFEAGDIAKKLSLGHLEVTVLTRCIS